MGNSESERRYFEQTAAKVYSTYFGPQWQEQLDRYLFAEVSVATEEDRRREANVIGWIGLAPLATEGYITRNRIQIFSNPNDFYLRTELGEALYNLLESISFKGKVYSIRQKGFPQGILHLLQQGVHPKEIVELCRSILDTWDEVYTEKPNRYHGMRPDRKRRYKEIPEWKSEGFSDTIAVEIRRRSGLSIDNREVQIWESIAPVGRQLIVNSADFFLPPVLSVE